MTDLTDNAPATARPESLLSARNNRRSALPYIVALSGDLQATRQRVRMRYIPDKLLVERSSFTTFLASLDAAESDAPEELALAILDEMNNEIVPRWIQISVGGNARDGTAETVTVEDCQPNWEPPDLLHRLPPL